MSSPKEIKMFNHGIFQEQLEIIINDLQIKADSEKEPYAKWNLTDQRKLAEKIFIIYKQTVDSQLN